MPKHNNGHSVSRRSLLKGLGLLGGGVAGTAVFRGLAGDGAQAVTQAGLPAAEDPVDPVVATTFMLEVDQLIFGYFQQCLNLGSENEVVEQKVMDASPVERVQKIPGRLKWLDPILRRAMTPNLDVWEWHRKVTEGNMDQARKNCTIYALDFEGSTVAQWNLLNAWPREIRGNLGRTGPDPNEPQMIEELVLTAEAVERVSLAALNGGREGEAVQAGDPLSGYFHKLEVNGQTYGFFVDVRNVGWDVEVVEQKVLGPGGVEVMQKIPGRARCRDVTLTRPISSDMSVWHWRQQVEQGNMASARGDGSIVAYDPLYVEAARLQVLVAWPQKLATSVGEDGALNESLTLTFESFQRVS